MSSEGENWLDSEPFDLALVDLGARVYDALPAGAQAEVRGSVHDPDDACVDTVWYWAGVHGFGDLRYILDLHSPEGRGVLLHLVRRAWGSPAIGVERSGDVWYVYCGHEDITSAPTETEALVVALEIAAMRRAAPETEPAPEPGWVAEDPGGTSPTVFTVVVRTDAGVGVHARLTGEPPHLTITPSTEAETAAAIRADETAYLAVEGPHARGLAAWLRGDQ